MARPTGATRAQREPRDTCLTCTHFGNAPAAIEAAIPGLTSFGSAYSAVRADDGICALNDRYVATGSSCAAHRRERSRAEHGVATLA